MTEKGAQALNSVPNSLDGLLTSRVDKLSPTEQVFLKVASVIGLIFPLSLIAEMQVTFFCFVLFRFALSFSELDYFSAFL